MKMLADLSRRLRELVSKVEELSLKDVPARLATYLLLQSEKNDNSDIVHLEISKSQLANLLGTIPETLSRIMRRMVSDDIIAFTKARSIRILSHERLNDLAFGELRLSKM
jgi:CRP/FNR family transcriptional regulator